jgi:hypothetical protein
VDEALRLRTIQRDRPAPSEFPDFSMKNVKRRDLSGFSRSYLEIDRTMIPAPVLTRCSHALR